MSFVFAGVIALAAIALQLLVFLAEASKPIPDAEFMAVFWPVVLGLPFAAFVAASHWFPHIEW